LGPELAERARLLLDRLPAQADAIDAFGPLQQAHRLTFVAHAGRAARGTQAAHGAQTAQAGRVSEPRARPADDRTARDAAGATPADDRTARDAAARAWERLDEPYPSLARCGARQRRRWTSVTGMGRPNG
jgi:hypothetical protein